MSLLRPKGWCYNLAPESRSLDPFTHVPSPFTAVQVSLDPSIYRPLVPLSHTHTLVDDEAQAYYQGGASSTSLSTPLRPQAKRLAFALWLP